jgi:hypothetical protein
VVLLAALSILGSLKDAQDRAAAGVSIQNPMVTLPQSAAWSSRARGPRSSRNLAGLGGSVGICAARATATAPMNTGWVRPTTAVR